MIICYKTFKTETGSQDTKTETETEAEAETETARGQTLQIKEHGGKCEHSNVT